MEDPQQWDKLKAYLLMEQLAPWLMLSNKIP